MRAVVVAQPTRWADPARPLRQEWQIPMRPLLPPEPHQPKCRRTSAWGAEPYARTDRATPSEPASVPGRASTLDLEAPEGSLPAREWTDGWEEGRHRSGPRRRRRLRRVWAPLRQQRVTGLFRQARPSHRRAVPAGP